MKKLATMTASLPYEIHPDNASAAVLALHGYTGSPSDLKYLARRLSSAGLAVSVPRLPGAGTDMNDLSNTTRNDWIRRAYDTWLNLCSRYESISILGYSMGGLLSLELSTRVRAEKLVLLAPALQTSHKIMKFTPFLAPFSRILPEFKTGWEPDENDDEDRREHGERYWVRRDIKSAAQFSLLQGKVLRKLKKVKIPVMAVVSKEDRTVPIEVLKILEQRLPGGLSRSLTVKNCGHNIPQGPDRVEVADAVCAWLLESTD